MKTVDEALRFILEAITPLDSETVGLHELVGRALANDMLAERTLPQWHNSAMDGYAVRTTDISSVPILLPVAEHIPAGDGSPRQLAAGTAHRIFTGAPLPAGADAVVSLTASPDCVSPAREAPARELPANTWPPGCCPIRTTSPCTGSTHELSGAPSISTPTAERAHYYKRW